MERQQYQDYLKRKVKNFLNFELSYDFLRKWKKLWVKQSKIKWNITI